MKTRKSTVQLIKHNKLVLIKVHAKRRTPKYVKNQKFRTTACRKIKKKALTDDEINVPLDPNEVPGNRFFRPSNPQEM